MLKLIVYDILLAFTEYAPFTVLSGITLIILICLLQGLFTGKSPVWIFRNNRRRLFLTFLFFIYCFAAFSITILSRAPGSRDEITLKLFATFTKDAYGNRYPVENIILFIPLGFLLPLLWSSFRRVAACLSAGFILSIMIEAVQYLTGRGNVQTDDVVMNTLGTLAGFWLFYGCRSIYCRLNRKTVS